MSARPIPPTSELTAPYWEAARRGELVVQRCASCAARPFPPRARCPRCGAASLSWAAVSGRGRVHSYTVAHRAPHPVFAGQLPLVIAIVELEEGPRLLTNVVGCDPAEVEVGMAVEVGFEPIDESEMVLPCSRPSGEPLPAVRRETRNGGVEMPSVETTLALRTETPGVEGWTRTARPGDPNKYFVVSADCHANEPNGWVKSRIDPKYRDRLPRLEVRDGESFIITDGNRPWKIRTSQTDWGPEDVLRNKTGYTPEERIADQDRDGVDVEIVFPNKGMHSFGTKDPGFAMAMCRAWNDWAHEDYGPYARILPMAMVPTIDVDAAIAELERVAKLGFRGITIPCKPEYGPTGMDHRNYNQPEFEPLWSAIEDVDLPVTIHVSTGRDPRAASGPGGAVINYAVHCCAASQEPVANLCASGVLERHPKLRFATIEAGIGWVPWLLEAMDEAFYKHRMWVSPELKEPPSFYYRRQGFSSFGEDRSGLALALEHDLVDNFMWANDYPHHEGTWPHSAAAIERTMGALNDDQRARILGGNAARFFGIERPAGR